MGSFCSGEGRLEENNVVIQGPPAANIKITAYEGNPDSFGQKVSSFFILSDAQGEAIAKRGLHRGQVASSSPIRQAVIETARYEGQVESHAPHGFGHLFNPEEDLVVGRFEKGLITAGSVIYVKNGDFLEIDSVTSIDPSNSFSSFVGKGKYYSKDGRKYEGDFLNGKKDGSGTFEWLNGSSYTGRWMNGMQHGYGKFTDASGKIIEGEFANGKKIKTA